MSHFFSLGSDDQQRLIQICGAIHEARRTAGRGWTTRKGQLLYDHHARQVGMILARRDLDGAVSYLAINFATGVVDEWMLKFVQGFTYPLLDNPCDIIEEIRQLGHRVCLRYEPTEGPYQVEVQPAEGQGALLTACDADLALACLEALRGAMEAGRGARASAPGPYLGAGARE